MNELVKLKEELIILLDKKTIRGFLSYCTNKVELNKRIINSTLFLDNNIDSKFIIFSERIYCILNDILSFDNVPKCKCGKKKKFGKFENGYKLSCGNRFCYQSLPQVTKKKKQTAIKNYGSLKNALYETAKKSIIKKYGVDNVSKLDHIKEKKKKTSLRKYNSEYPWQSEKGKLEQKNGVIKKYNVDNISKLESIKLKKEKTSINNWGTRNPSQNITIRKKILKKNGNEYIFKSGRKCLVDGNENIVLNYLCKIYNENNLFPQPNIKISYYLEERERFWFPDLLIKDINKNKLVEIKSLEFIFSCVHDIKQKIQGGLNSGYDSLVILEYKKNLYLLSLLNFEDNLWGIKTIIDNDNILDFVIEKLEKNNFKIFKE